MRGAIMLVAVAALVGCGRESAAARPNPAERVGELLYAQNLISDPAVSAKMMEYAGAVDGRGVPADSVLPELHAWLEAWASAHPESVERARLMPRLSSGPAK